MEADISRMRTKINVKPRLRSENLSSGFRVFSGQKIPNYSQLENDLEGGIACEA